MESTSQSGQTLRPVLINGTKLWAEVYRHPKGAGYCARYTLDAGAGTVVYGKGPSPEDALSHLAERLHSAIEFQQGDAMADWTRLSSV